jgi:hypothetical protein
MRLNEFTDPRDYLPTEANTARLLEQIEAFWPARPEDDDGPSLIRPKKRSPNNRVKPVNAV